MASSVSESTRQLVRERANFTCEYCQSAELLTGLKCEIDHIIPKSRHGTDDFENLCAACTVCNGHKYNKVEGVDPGTNHPLRLFHPREQTWHEHFQWDANGTHILGVTACGRVTIDALNLNEPLRVAARTIWVQTGRHPPK